MMLGGVGVWSGVVGKWRIGEMEDWGDGVLGWWGSGVVGTNIDTLVYYGLWTMLPLGLYGLWIMCRLGMGVCGYGMSRCRYGQMGRWADGQMGRWAVEAFDDYPPTIYPLTTTYDI
jgi:hypothetical protein